MSQNIHKTISKFVTIQLLLLGLSGLLLPAAAFASSVNVDYFAANNGGTNLQTDISPGQLPKPPANQSSVKNILRIVFGIIGSFALLSITLSGMKYITSAGSPQKTSEAKNGIVYALLGLIIAISAEAIVAFVVKYP